MRIHTKDTDIGDFGADGGLDVAYRHIVDSFIGNDQRDARLAKAGYGEGDHLAVEI